MSNTRRKLGFWKEFNDWWRELFEGLGRRPEGREIACWYEREADKVWSAAIRPSLEETRTHAKCMRSLDTVREYFRAYRSAKRKSHREDTSEEGEPNEEDEERYHPPTTARIEPDSSAGTGRDEDASTATQDPPLPIARLQAPAGAAGVAPYPALPLATPHNSYPAFMNTTNPSLWPIPVLQPCNPSSTPNLTGTAKLAAAGTLKPARKRAATSKSGALPPPISALAFARVKPEPPAPAPTSVLGFARAKSEPPAPPPPPRPPPAKVASPPALPPALPPKPMLPPVPMPDSLPGLPSLAPIKTTAREPSIPLAPRSSVTLPAPLHPAVALDITLEREPTLDYNLERALDDVDADEEIEELICELSQATPCIGNLGWAQPLAGRPWQLQQQNSTGACTMADLGPGLPRAAHSAPVGPELMGSYTTWQPRRTVSGDGEVCSPPPRAPYNAAMGKRTSSNECLSLSSVCPTGQDNRAMAGLQRQPQFQPQQQVSRQQQDALPLNLPSMFYQPPATQPQQEYVLRNNMVVPVPMRTQSWNNLNSGMRDAWAPAAGGALNGASGKDLRPVVTTHVGRDPMATQKQWGSAGDLTCVGGLMMKPQQQQPLFFQQQQQALILQHQQQHLALQQQHQQASHWGGQSAWSLDAPQRLETGVARQVSEPSLPRGQQASLHAGALAASQPQNRTWAVTSSRQVAVDRPSRSVDLGLPWLSPTPDARFQQGAIRANSPASPLQFGGLGVVFESGW